jgi:hypothetical protein
VDSGSRGEGTAAVLVVAMVLAACWGVLQLAVLGSATRSVRAGTLLLAVGAGVYGCGLLAVAVQYAWTRLYAGASGNPVYQVVDVASYTVDPFIEEVAKVLPLLVLAWSARARLQRGLTDHLLLGAATGAGFGLLEALMRFGSRAGTAVGMPGGWVLPISLSPPMVPSPGSTMTSWLPAPAGGDGLLSFGAGTGTNLHLAWSALAGLGVGLLVRGRGPVRLRGPLLVALVGADHAAYNYDLRHPGHGDLAAHLAAPFVAAQPLLWLWPLLALAAAIVVGVRWLRRARSLAPDLRLRRERDTTRLGAGLAGYAVLGLPWWTLLVIARFVGLRRSALYGLRQAGAARVPGRAPLRRPSRCWPRWSVPATSWTSPTQPRPGVAWSGRERSCHPQPRAAAEGCAAGGRSCCGWCSLRRCSCTTWSGPHVPQRRRPPTGRQPPGRTPRRSPHRPRHAGRTSGAATSTNPSPSPSWRTCPTPTNPAPLWST